MLCIYKTLINIKGEGNDVSSTIRSLKSFFNTSPRLMFIIYNINESKSSKAESPQTLVLQRSPQHSSEIFACSISTWFEIFGTKKVKVIKDGVSTITVSLFKFTNLEFHWLDLLRKKAFFFRLTKSRNDFYFSSGEILEVTNAFFQSFFICACVVANFSDERYKKASVEIRL